MTETIGTPNSGKVPLGKAAKRTQASLKRSRNRGPGEDAPEVEEVEAAAPPAEDPPADPEPDPDPETDPEPEPEAA